MPDFKNLNIRLLTINLVVLIVAFLINDPAHLFESTYAKSPRLLKFKTKSEISEVVISPLSGPQLTLKKSESRWSVKASDQDKDFPADFNHIEKALDNLMDLHKFYEVTVDGKKFQEFEVDEKALKIELKGSGKDVQMFIGKQGSTFNTSLIRLQAEKIVYSVKGNLKSDWNQNMDYFRNKRLFQFAKENINEVIATGPVSYDLKNSEEKKWVLSAGNTTVDTNDVKVNRLIDEICLLEGTEFYQGTVAGFPYGNIQIQLKSNTGFSLTIHRTGNDFLIKSEHNPFWQKIPDYRINTLFPPIAELKVNNNVRQ